MAIPSVLDLVQHYDLQPHPEGGFFRESYRATGLIPQTALSASFSGDRAYSTAIYFLLPQGTKSSWHQIQSDETWHFYLGGPLTILHISPKGEFSAIRLGADILNGEMVQYTVPAGYWFGAIPAPESAYCFVGCTVAPGFDFSEFTLIDPEKLIEQFPQHEKHILRLAN